MLAALHTTGLSGQSVCKRMQLKGKKFKEQSKQNVFVTVLFTILQEIK